MLLTKYYLSDRIMKSDMSGTCSMYGGESQAGFCWGNPRERGQLEDPGVYGRIILKWIFRKWDGGSMDWIDWLRIGVGGRHL